MNSGEGNNAAANSNSGDVNKKRRRRYGKKKPAAVAVSPADAMDVVESTIAQLKPNTQQQQEPLMPRVMSSAVAPSSLAHLTNVAFTSLPLSVNSHRAIEQIGYAN